MLWLCVFFCLCTIGNMSFWNWFLALFFFKQKTAYEMRISDWVQTCALPILLSRPIDAAALQQAIMAANDSTNRQRLHASAFRIAFVAAQVEIGRAPSRERV